MTERDLIDRVAREMTDAEPSGDFRVRVIASLPDARPQRWWQYVVLAGGGVALGILITALLGPMGQGPRLSGSVAVGPAAQAGQNRTVTPISAAQPVRTPRSGSNINSVLGPAGPVGPASEEPFFPRLSISPIQPSELSIAPIVVGPIALSPIDSRTGGRQK